MKRTGKCPKCGSSKVVSDAKVQDHGHFDVVHEMAVSTDRNPEALIFKGTRKSKVSAWVCTACGLVEFYADTPASVAP